jgi:hypothetical protein
MVEMLNLCMRTRRVEPVHPHQPYLREPRH